MVGFESDSLTRVFISYSRVDVNHLEALETALATVKRQGKIVTWTDRALLPGQTWEPALLKAIRSSDVVLLLVSPDYMASDYIQDVELKEVFARHARGEVQIFSVLLRPTDLNGDKLDLLPRLPGKRGPITTWENRDEAWLEVVKELRQLLDAAQPPLDGNPEHAEESILRGYAGEQHRSLMARVQAQNERTAKTRKPSTRLLLAVACLFVLVAGLWIGFVWLQSALDEGLIPGIRVIKRVTTLDLDGWQETTEADIANRVKRSRGVSSNHFTITKTRPSAKEFVHIIGTTSKIAPDVSCRECEVRPLTLSSMPLTPHEWAISFDISRYPLLDNIDIYFTVEFWNAFQDRSQLWGGFRILHDTEESEYSIVFPPTKQPLANMLRYVYFSGMEIEIPRPEVSLRSTEQNRVIQATWRVLSPHGNRSYRIGWDWSR